MESWLVEKYGFRSTWDSYSPSGQSHIRVFEFDNEKDQFLFYLRWSDRIEIYNSPEEVQESIEKSLRIKLEDIRGRRKT